MPSGSESTWFAINHNRNNLWESSQSENHNQNRRCNYNWIKNSIPKIQSNEDHQQRILRLWCCHNYKVIRVSDISPKAQAGRIEIPWWILWLFQVQLKSSILAISRMLTQSSKCNSRRYHRNSCTSERVKGSWIARIPLRIWISVNQRTRNSNSNLCISHISLRTRMNSQIILINHPEQLSLQCLVFLGNTCIDVSISKSSQCYKEGIQSSSKIRFNCQSLKMKNSEEHLLPQSKWCYHKRQRMNSNSASAKVKVKKKIQLSSRNQREGIHSKLKQQQQQ